jgi:Pvc16 N-terminal domain
MSSSVGIAAVSAVLKSILEQGLERQRVAQSLGVAATVSLLAPSALQQTATHTGSQLTMFLYAVTQNSALRNAPFLPRTTQPGVMGAPALALNLHYLLTANSGDELHTEALLGAALLQLHETPVLSRDVINQAFISLDASPLSQAIARAALAAQAESLKITLTTLPVNELAPLWAAMRAPYRPSVTFQVSALLIDYGSADGG